MSGALKVAGWVGLLGCLVLFGFVGVPTDNPLPSIVAYASVGFLGAGAFWLAEQLDR